MSRMFLPLIFSVCLLIMGLMNIIYDSHKASAHRPKSENRDQVSGIFNFIILCLIALFLIIHWGFNDSKQKSVYKFAVNNQNALYSDRTLCIKSPLEMYTFVLGDSADQTNTINHLNGKDTSEFYYIVKKNIYGGMPSSHIEIVHKQHKKIEVVPKPIMIEKENKTKSIFLGGKP